MNHLIYGTFIAHYRCAVDVGLLMGIASESRLQGSTNIETANDCMQGCDVIGLGDCIQTIHGIRKEKPLG